MTQNPLRLHVVCCRIDEAAPQDNCVLQLRWPLRSNCFLTVRWRGRRYLIVDFESLDAIIARQPGKRRLEPIPVNEAAPDHASHIVSAWTPDLASVPEEAWQKAVKRFKILKPLLFEDAASVCVEHIMVLAPKERLSEPRGWAVIKPDDLRSGNHHPIGVSILFHGNQEGPADVWPGGAE